MDGHLVLRDGVHGTGAEGQVQLVVLGDAGGEVDLMDSEVDGPGERDQVIEGDSQTFRAGEDLGCGEPVQEVLVGDRDVGEGGHRGLLSHLVDLCRCVCACVVCGKEISPHINQQLIG
jgi:hypothetical protein